MYPPKLALDMKNDEIWSLEYTLDGVQWSEKTELGEELIIRQKLKMMEFDL